MDGTSRFFDGNRNNDNFVTGWTVGGGLEWKRNTCTSTSAIITTIAATNGFNNFRDNARLTADTVKLGFNYFWNAPPVPLK